MGVYYSDKIKTIIKPNNTKSTSRYKTKYKLVNIDGTTKVRFIRKRDITFGDDTYSIHVVQPHEYCRPDIIAAEYFGDEKYSWVILAANNIKTPFQITVGTRLVIPSLYSLQGSQGKLVTR